MEGEQGRVVAGELDCGFAVDEGGVRLVEGAIKEGEMAVQCALGVGGEGALEHGLAEVDHLRVAAEFGEDAEEPGLNMDAVGALNEGFGDDFL